MQTEFSANQKQGNARLTRRQAMLDVALALVLTVAGGVLAGLIGANLMAWLELPLILVLVLQGLIIVAGLQLLLAWRGQGWRQIGLKPPRAKDFGLALVALLLVFALNIAVNLLASRFVPGMAETHQERLAGFGALLAGDLPLVAVGVAMLFTGFYEEALARGFLLTRCKALLAGNWGPVLLSSILFGLGHFYQGWFGVVQTALVGIVFARLALRWGTLWPVIIAHGALNTLSLAMFRYM